MYGNKATNKALNGKMPWPLAQSCQSGLTECSGKVPDKKLLTCDSTEVPQVQNALQDLWALMDFAQPGLLGNHATFTKRFNDPIECLGHSMDCFVEQQV